MHGERIKIKVQAPPDKGRANQALINFLAELLEIPKSFIVIVSGHASQLKKVEIEGNVDISRLHLH